ELGFPGGRGTRPMRLDNRFALLVRNQPRLEPALGVVRTGVADPQREMELALRILAADEIKPLRGRFVPFSLFGGLGIGAKGHAIGLNEPLPIEELQLAFRFEDLDSRLGEVSPPERQRETRQRENNKNGWNWNHA